MLRKNFPGRKETRREEAKERQAERDKRTTQQQLDRLNQVLGEGQGATKERARLQKMIDAA